MIYPKEQVYVMYFLKVFSLSILFLFFGCGKTNSFSTNSTVSLNEQAHYNSDDINVSRAIENIKSQMQHIVKIYVSKDKKDLFVYKRLNVYEKSYALYDYDITGDLPKLRDEIISGYRAYVSQLSPLHNGYIVYEGGLFSTRIIIYDYIRKQKVRTYAFHEDLGKFSLNSDETHIKIGNHTLNINDLYQEYPHFTNEEALLYYDGFVLDKDNKFLIEQYYIEDKKLISLEEAVEYCKSLPRYNWHLPTKHELIVFSRNKEKYAISSLFGFRDYKGYWVQPKEKNATHSFTYSFNDYSSFIYEDGTNDFFARCIANKPENVKFP